MLQLFQKHLTTIRWVITILLVVGIFAHFGKIILDRPTYEAVLLTLGPSFLLLYFNIARPVKGNSYKTYVPFLAIPAILFGIWAFFVREFGTFEITSIIFHLTEGVDQHGSKATTYRALLFITLITLFVGSISYMGARSKSFALFDKLACLPLLLINPAIQDLSGGWFHNQQKLKLLSHYQSTKSLPPLTDKKRKNIIWIYLESTEATFQNKQFGRIFDDLSSLAKQGLTIQGIKEIKSTNWTLAGQIASQCGLPLLSLGFLTEKRLGNVKSFLPGADCLGDLLKRHGYQTAYLNNVGLGFAGQGKFFKQHHFDIIKGVDEIPHPQNYHHDWGLYDDTLFDALFAQINHFKQQKKPFFLNGLTIGAHPPDGYISKSCQQKLPPVKPQILEAVQCTSWLTKQFIKRLKDKGLLKDSIVIISSDHLIKRTPVRNQLNALERTNFFMALGEGIKSQLIKKTASMIDVYPTILELIGFHLPNRRAGLGVSLLSNKKTLLETYGLEHLNKSILYDKALRKHVWDLK